MSSIVVAWRLLVLVPKPLLAVAFFGWILMAGNEVLPAMPDLCFSTPSVIGRVTTQIDAAFSGDGLISIVLSWLVMIVAMMPPLLSGPLLHIWRRSFSRRRPRALAGFLLGYLSIWIVVGVVLVPFALVLSGLSLANGFWPVLPAILVAIFWQLTPYKQQSLNRCHERPPLAAFGTQADIDVLRFGLARGISCAGSCWAFMLVILVSAGIAHWALMAAAMMIALLERNRGPQTATWFTALRVAV